MQQANRTILEQYRSYYNSWVSDQVLNNMDGKAINDILGVIRAEWDPAYTVNSWCGHCRAKMIEFAFQRMDADKQTDTDVVKIKL